jgi:16S rRNA (cytidine1402-2'-O)-methyltransferase
LKKLSKEDLAYFNETSSHITNGCLYIIATPIGNYEDISLRTLKLLNFVDILLCEDTRKTAKLLSFFNIKHNKLISYNDHNGEKKRPYIINQLLLKNTVGLVSDAGTPLISDPGYKLVKECYMKSIIVTHAPGPSAVINALVLSCLPSNQFYFGGFILSNKAAKKNQFLPTKHMRMTGIWFDTCLRLKNTLEIMKVVYGNRKISIMRELTKIYEDIILSDLNNVMDLLTKRENDNKPLKGEIVLVIEGYKNCEALDMEKLRVKINDKLINLSVRDTVNTLFSETGISKKKIYEETIKIKKL